MFKDLVDVVFPRYCPACGRRLLPDEQFVCLDCLVHLPRVNDMKEGNPAELRLLGRVPYEHGVSFCYYSSRGGFASILKKAKYKSMPWLDRKMTQLFVRELRRAASPWPYDIDCIVPIPVHWHRQVWRGYNQCAAIAEVLSEEWHLPIEYDCLIKDHSRDSQVGKTFLSRLSSWSECFSVRHPERLQGRHLLLVDDVMTTGSTLDEAYHAICRVVPQCRISFLTLGMARN